jgi:hypothetical protein
LNGRVVALGDAGNGRLDRADKLGRRDLVIAALDDRFGQAGEQPPLFGKGANVMAKSRAPIISTPLLPMMLMR